MLDVFYNTNLMLCHAKGKYYLCIVYFHLRLISLINLALILPGEVGFLSDQARINVAATRAKHHLCIVGDSERVSRRGGVLKSLVNYANEYGVVLASDVFG